MYPRASGVPDEKSFSRVTGSAEKSTLKGLLLVSLLLIVRVVFRGLELTGVVRRVREVLCAGAIVKPEVEPTKEKFAFDKPMLDMERFSVPLFSMTTK
jgi:hypothetical protein